MSASEIRDLLTQTGMAVSDVLSTRSVPFRELELAARSLPDDDLITLLATHSALMRRPIAVVDNRAIVGFSSDAYVALTATLKASRSNQE